MNENIQLQPKQISEGVLQSIEGRDLETESYDTLVQMGIGASEVKTYTQWILGKLGHAVMRKYGDLKKYAAEIRLDYGALRQYMYTYRKFTQEDSEFHPEKYYGSVPWGVLALAATKTDKPQELLGKLQIESKEVSLAAAYREIKRLESPNNQQPPRKPVVKLQWDKNSNLYRLVMDRRDFPAIDWSAVKADLTEWLAGLV